MKKITLDRLPSIFPKENIEDVWDLFSAEEQKKRLLDYHDKVLDQSHELLQLILEMDK